MKRGRLKGERVKRGRLTGGKGEEGEAQARGKG